jgi:ATP/maltotriose-dependent transcriptional regulator MalT
MMTTNLLITKFYQLHLSPKQIRRKHLVQRLWQGVESGHRLALVSAPAGYGKSMAVAEWLGELSEEGETPWHTGKVTVSWLSLAPSDNDMGRFFTDFLAALNQKENVFCKDLFASLRAGEIPGVNVTRLTERTEGWAAGRHPQPAQPGLHAHIPFFRNRRKQMQPSLTSTYICRNEHRSKLQ